MRAKIRKIDGIFPVTVDSAVYIEGTNKSIKDKLNEINPNGINILSLAKIMNKDITIPTECREVIQNAVDNYGDIYIPNGEYKIDRTIKLKAQSTKGFKMVGESYINTKLILDSNVPDTHIFEIEGVSSWSNRYKYIQNICLKANKAELQSIVRYKEDETTSNIFDSGVQIKQCTIYTSGYVLDFRDCPWVGNLYVKDCEVIGNGLVKFKSKSKLNSQYWHASSTLVLEDIHFSGTANRRGAVIDLIGCQNTVINRCTVEGQIYNMKSDPDDIGGGWIGSANYEGGLFMSLKDSSANIISCWFETGGVDNCPNGKSYYIGAEGPSVSNPFMNITFKSTGYFQLNKQMIIGSGIVNGTVHNVIFDDLYLYNLRNSENIIVQDGGLLTINNLGTPASNQYFTFKLENNTRIKILNKWYSNSESGNSAIGDGGFNSLPDSEIIYKYMGGYQDTPNNLLFTTERKYTGKARFYPHFNSIYGNTLLLKPDDHAFRLALCTLEIKGEKRINSYLKIRLHHPKDTSKHGTIKEFITSKVYKDQIVVITDGDLYKSGYIPAKDSCEFVEILALIIYEGNGHITKDSSFNNTISKQTRDIYGTLYPTQTNLEGTWKRGDEVIMLDGISKTVFKTDGTTRHIDISDIEFIDSKTIKVNSIESFKTIVDGDYIKINTNGGWINNVITQTIYEETNYLIKLKDSMSVSTTTVTQIINNTPTKELITNFSIKDITDNEVME